jgi:hypothetical protein
MLFCVSFVCQILQFTHIVELSIAWHNQIIGFFQNFKIIRCHQYVIL